MIHKVIIVGLTLAAVGVYSLRFVNYIVPSPILFYVEDAIHVYHLGRRVVNGKRSRLGGQQRGDRLIVEVGVDDVLEVLES